MGSGKRDLEKKKPVSPVASPPLLEDLRRMIEETRQGVAATVNAGLTLLYWRVGKRVGEEILKGERAEYGKEILATVSQELARDYGGGFSSKNIHHMLRFVEAFPDMQIVSTLSRQLSWSHFKEIIYLKLPLQKDFYAEMCRIERWSVRTLREKIGSMLYERTALSRKPEDLARIELDALRDENALSPDLVFRDPYLLDFLGLTGAFQERDLEAAILREMEAFILELGIGFSFVARQKRITLDGDDFYLDLLFFHRRLRRLVAIELKLDKFRPEHKGQMELYLRWLDKNERNEGEYAPIGMILCAGKNQEQIELLELSQSGIHVAEYLVELPPRELLAEKLQRAIALARARLGATTEEKA
ncbi:MAG: PDDEXK nuclease domain-containing protein [FCB group bacterium]|nr:PDDEXK nuclease domain-containing protein [FCB group bacterium]